MAERKFQPGFRLSLMDVVVLVAGGATAAYFALIDTWTGIAIAFAVLHFFLFCNVLRMSRLLELMWAGAFTGLTVASTVFGLLSWPAVFGISSIVTIVVMAVEMRKPSYHGAGWQKLNPRLPEWWQAVAVGTAG